MIRYIAIAAILGLLGSIGTAFGETETKSYILTPDCESLTWLVDNSKLADPYRAYVGEYEIVCAPFVKDVSQTRQYADLIRTAELDAKLVFVYDLRSEMQRLDLQRLITVENGNAPHKVRGWANINEGWAVTTFGPEESLHELAHLILEKGHCGYSNNPAEWIEMTAVCSHS